MTVFLTTTDVAQLAGVSGDTVRYWARNGLIRVAGTTMNGTRLYRRDDIEKLVGRRLVGKHVTRKKRRNLEPPSHFLPGMEPAA